MHCSSLLFLVGGGRDPRYPPNKVIFWNEALGKEVAELEFREKVRGLACRRGWLAVALRRRVVAFEIGESVKRYGEWDTYDNSRGELRGVHIESLGSFIEILWFPPPFRFPYNSQFV
jgi:WD repeat-containing protein 45